MPDGREEAIRQRAHALWQKEGRPDGRDLEHWLRAEAEISGKKYAGVTDNGKFIEHPTGAAADPQPRRRSRSR
jgi:Protein of unknown function (DUF2934)